MDFIEACIEEIALEGLDGITLSALWTRLETRCPTFPLKLDEHSKDYLWSVVIVPADSLEFYVLKEPRPPLIIANRFDEQQNNVKQVVPVPDIYPLYLLTTGKSRCDTCSMLGSCSEFYTRRCVTTEIRTDAGRARLVLSEAIRRWGERLVIVANQTVRSKALVGTSGLMDDSFSGMNIYTYALLERIGRSRYNGEVSHDYNKLFKMQPKNMFYMRRCLWRIKLITVQQYNLSNIENTMSVSLPGKLCHLTRFKVDYRPKTLVLIHDLCNLLLSSPTQMMRLVDIRGRMGLKESMQKKLFQLAKKYVRMEVVPYKTYDPDASEAQCLVKSGASERIVKVAVLIKPFSFNASAVDDDEPDDDDEYDEEAALDDDMTGGLDFSFASADNFTHLDKAGVSGSTKSFMKPSDFLLCERTVQDQVYNAVDAMGTEGLNKSDLVSRLGLSMLEARLVTRNLQRRGILSGIWMDARKVKYERLLSTRHTKEEVCTSWINPSSGRPILANTVTVAAHGGTNAAIAAAAAAAAAKVTAGVTDGDSQMSDLIGSDPSDYFNPSAALLGPEDMSRRDVDGDEDEADDSVDASSQPDMCLMMGRKVRASARNRARIETILEEISEQKIIYNTTPLIRRIRSQEEVYIDRKTLQTLLQLLIGLKKIVCYKRYLQLPSGGTQEIVLYCMEGIKENDTRIDGVMEGIAHQAASSSSSNQGFTTPGRGAIKRNNSSVDKNGGFEKDGGLIGGDSELDLTASGTGYDLNISRRLGHLPRLSRLKVLHKYMWFLAYGQNCRPTTNENGSVNSTNLKLEADVRDDDSDWQQYVPHLPRRGFNEGWINVGDAFSYLPIKLLCQITSIPYQIDGLEAVVADAQARYTPICQLPKDMYHKILHRRRQVHLFYEECKSLARAGLLSLERAELKEKEQISVYIHRYASVVDTTGSMGEDNDTDNDTDTEEGEERDTMKRSKRRMKRVSRFELKEFNDLINYWKFLQYICLNTPQASIRFEIEDTERKRVARRFEDCMKGRGLREICDRGDIPGDGLGAGGLDSSFWSHRKRNWLNKMSSQLQVDEMYSGGGGHDSKPYYLTTVVKCEPIDDEDDLAAAAAAAADYDAAAGFVPPAVGDGFDTAGVVGRSYDTAGVRGRTYDSLIDDALGDSQSNDSRSVDRSVVNDGGGFNSTQSEEQKLSASQQDSSRLKRFGSDSYDSVEAKKQRKLTEGAVAAAAAAAAAAITAAAASSASAASIRIKPITGGRSGGGGRSSGGGGRAKRGTPKEKKEKKDRKDEVDMMAMQNKTRQRVQWTDPEDNMLLLCVLTSSFMTSFKSRMLVPNKVLRDIMHENFEASKDKDSDACKRRLAYIMKSSEAQQRINVFLADALHNQRLVEEYRAGRNYGFAQATVAENERLFRSCLLELRSIFKFFQTVEGGGSLKRGSTKHEAEESGREAGDVFLLPDSMEELRRRYVVSVAVECGIAAGLVKVKTEPGAAGGGVGGVARGRDEQQSLIDLQISLIHNIIHCAMLLTDEEGGKGQELYQLMKSYPESLVDSVFTDLRQDGMITKVKKGIYERKPLGSTLGTYMLSLRYAYSFNAMFPRSMFLPTGQLFFSSLYSPHLLSPNVIGSELSQSEAIQFQPSQCYSILIACLVTAGKFVLETIVPDQIIVVDNLASPLPSAISVTRRRRRKSQHLYCGGEEDEYMGGSNDNTYEEDDNDDDTINGDDVANHLISGAGDDEIGFDDEEDEDSDDDDWTMGGGKPGKKPNKKRKGRKGKSGKNQVDKKSGSALKNKQPKLNVSPPESCDWLDTSQSSATISSRIGLSLSRSQYAHSISSRNVLPPDNVLINSCTISARMLHSASPASSPDQISDALDAQIYSLPGIKLRKELRSWNHSNSFIHPRTCDLILRRAQAVLPTSSGNTESSVCDSGNSVVEGGKEERSIQLCSSIYRSVSGAGLVGISEKELQDKYSRDNSSEIRKCGLLLQEALSHLINAKLVLKVGVTECRYVTVENSAAWTIKINRNQRLYGGSPHEEEEVFDEAKAFERLRNILKAEAGAQSFDVGQDLSRSSAVAKVPPKLRRDPEECSVIILTCAAASVADAAARAAMKAAAGYSAEEMEDIMNMDDDSAPLWPPVGRGYTTGGDVGDATEERSKKRGAGKAPRGRKSRAKFSFDESDATDLPPAEKPRRRRRVSNKVGRGARQATETERSVEARYEMRNSGRTTRYYDYDDDDNNGDNDEFDDVEMMKMIRSVDPMESLRKGAKDKLNRSDGEQKQLEQQQKQLQQQQRQLQQQQKELEQQKQLDQQQKELEQQQKELQQQIQQQLHQKQLEQQQKLLEQQQKLLEQQQKQLEQKQLEQQQKQQQQQKQLEQQQKQQQKHQQQTSSDQEQVSVFLQSNKQSKSVLPNFQRPPSPEPTNKRHLSPSSVDERQTSYSSNDQKHPSSALAYQKQTSSASTNQKTPPSALTDEKQSYSVSANHKQPLSSMVNDKQATVTTNQRDSIPNNDRQPIFYPHNQKSLSPAPTSDTQPIFFSSHRKPTSPSPASDKQPLSFSFNEKPRTPSPTSQRSPVFRKGSHAASGSTNFVDERGCPEGSGIPRQHGVSNDIDSAENLGMSRQVVGTRQPAAHSINTSPSNPHSPTARVQAPEIAESSGYVDQSVRRHTSPMAVPESYGYGYPRDNPVGQRVGYDYLPGYPTYPMHHWMQSAMVAHDMSRNLSSSSASPGRHSAQQETPQPINFTQQDPSRNHPSSSSSLSSGRNSGAVPVQRDSSQHLPLNFSPTDLSSERQAQNLSRDFNQSVFSAHAYYQQPLQQPQRSFSRGDVESYQGYPSRILDSQGLGNISARDLSRESLGYRLGMGDMSAAMNLSDENEWLLRRYQLHQQQQLLLQHQQLQQQQSGGISGEGSSRYSRHLPQLDGPADSDDDDDDDDDDVDDCILDVHDDDNDEDDVVDDDDDDDVLSIQTPERKRARFDLASDALQTLSSSVQRQDCEDVEEYPDTGPTDTPPTPSATGREEPTPERRLRAGRGQTTAEEEPPRLSTYKTVRLVPRPWRTPEGTVNRTALRMMLESVMATIMEFPGLTQTELCTRYTTVLQPVPVLELIEMLEDIGCVEHGYVYKSSATNAATSKTLVFSPRSTYNYVEAAPALEDDLGDDIERAELLLARGVSGDVIYHATTECILKLGQFLVQLTAGLRSTAAADSSDLAAAAGTAAL